MNKQTYDKVVEELTKDRKQVSKGKRQDYTKGSDDVLANFKNQAKALGLTPMQSLAVHMEKQISAVFNYIKTNGQSESEPIIKRIGDSINYLELLWGLINDQEEKTVIELQGIYEKELGYEVHYKNEYYTESIKNEEIYLISMNLEGTIKELITNDGVKYIIKR